MAELTKDKMGDDEASGHEPKYHERQYTRPINLSKTTEQVWLISSDLTINLIRGDFLVIVLYRKYYRVRAIKNSDKNLLNR